MGPQPIQERTWWEGRPLVVTWRPSAELPPTAVVTQVSGVCFTEGDQILLVSCNGEEWALPGGHPEPGESWVETLCREVEEEASASVAKTVYLGAQEVADPTRPCPPRLYYQIRFWARVRLDPFRARFETRQRRLVSPRQFCAILNWDTGGIAQALLEVALEAGAILPRQAPMDPARPSAPEQLAEEDEGWKT